MHSLDIKNKMNEGKRHCGIASSMSSSSSSIGIVHEKPSLHRRCCDSVSLCCDVIHKTSDHSTKSCGSSVTFHNKCDDPSIQSAMESSGGFSAAATTTRKVDQ